MPLGNLSPGIVTDLFPVLSTGPFCCCSQDQPPNHLISGSPFRIQNQKFNTYLFKTLTRNIKDKQFIEHCIGGAFLHMSLLFGDSLFGMVQVHFHVGICNGKNRCYTGRTWLESWFQYNGALGGYCVPIKWDCNENESEQSENLYKAWLLYYQQIDIM